jgi:hypothetical protein
MSRLTLTLSTPYWMKSRASHPSVGPEGLREIRWLADAMCCSRERGAISATRELPHSRRQDLLFTQNVEAIKLRNRSPTQFADLLRDYEGTRSELGRIQIFGA